jgi:competence protein ComEA
MSFLSRREQMIIISLIILILTLSLFNFIKKEVFSKDKDEDNMVENIIDETDVEGDTHPEEIVVHISGQVHNPGIVKLEPGARVIDAVNAAGGLKKDADLDKINLARKLQDEEKIYIPKIGEDISENISYFQNPAGGSNKININTCTKEELMSLPGIGEVLADRIIQYREKTPFKKIEDLMNVSGIGEKKFESIKDMIIVP